MSVARLLVIAGSDSSAGAGLQADLKTAQAFGVYAQTVVTAVTAQSTQGVTAIQVMPPVLVRAQIEAAAAPFNTVTFSTSAGLILFKSPGYGKLSTTTSGLGFA